MTSKRHFEVGDPVEVVAAPIAWHGDTGVIDRIDPAQPTRIFAVRMDRDPYGVMWFAPRELKHISNGANKPPIDGGG